MERIFNGGARGPLAGVAPSGKDDPDFYEYSVLALIQDAVSYEESDLAPNRETATRYYYGMEPSLDGKEVMDLTGDPPVTDEAADNRSTVVSTDVKDTVLSIMPTLMRIFGGTEHALEFLPNYEGASETAAFATDYVRKVIWQDNDGFNILHGAFKDALTTRLGIITWWTDKSPEVTERTFDSVSRDQLGMLLEEAKSLNPEILGSDGVEVVDGIQYAKNVTIRYTKVKPKTVVAGVPPEEFRVSRNAKTVKDAQLVGHESFVRVSDLVEKGYDADFIASKAGSLHDWSEEKFLRNPGYGTDFTLNDYVRYGSFYVRVDKDGDGINELRHIQTVGEDYQIIDDEIANYPRFATLTPDPTPHTLVGDSAADLVMDIQRINTNLLRAGFDSLTTSIFPRTAFNQLTVNVDDILNDDPSDPIRVRGNPAENLMSFTQVPVAREAFEAKGQMDIVRQMRTGISEASKGLDPRALQSTNVVGVEAVLSGAQERIELIALIFAHGGMKDLYKGLLQEISDNAPNKAESVKLRGKWVQVNPSLFDASMGVEVNPALGKGSDQARLMGLMHVAEMQQNVVAKFGMGNGVVGPEEMRNTIVDIMSLNNIRNHSRYFRELTPEQIQAIETAPTEPSPELIIAQSAMEEVRSKTASAIGKQQIEEKKITQKSIDDAADRDQKRDEVNINAFIKLAEIATNGILASAEADAAVDAEVEPRNTDA